MKRLFILLLLNAVLVSCKKDSTKLVPANPSAPFFSVYPGPVKGYVGDVMPFYDNNTFHLFFLMDWRDNAPQYHPWYKFNTTDLFNYTYQGQMISRIIHLVQALLLRRVLPTMVIIPAIITYF